MCVNMLEINQGIDSKLRVIIFDLGVVIRQANQDQRGMMGNGLNLISKCPRDYCIIDKTVIVFNQDLNSIYRLW